MRATNALFFPLILLFGCSSSSGASPGQSGGQANIDQWCSAYCAADEKCDSKVDDATCENTCHNLLASYGTHWRADFVAGFTSCIATDDCTDVKNNGNKCQAQAGASLAPTATAQAYCQQVSDKAKTCSGSTTDVASCLNAVKVIDDASLQNAIDCLSKPCDQYLACAASAAGL